MANDERAVVPRNQGGYPAERPAAPQRVEIPSIDTTHVAPEIMARAVAIAADVMTNGGQINAAQALSAAYHFHDTGEIIGRHAYVGTTGNVAGKVIEGYRGVAREMDMSKYTWRYRALTDAERADNSVGEKDASVCCELTVLAARRQCIEMKIPYDPICGYCIVRQNETLRVPTTKTKYWVMQKRARVDALRQVGENTSVEDVLEEAGVAAPDHGRLNSVEQAEAWVNAQIEQQNREQAQAAAEALIQEHVAQQQMAEDAPVAPRCPDCGAAMRDGRPLKAQGKLKENAPDWACSDPFCDGKYWPGQWPLREHPSDEQMVTLKALVNDLYPQREDRKLFRDWYVQTFVDVDIKGATSITDLLHKLNEAQAAICIAALQDAQQRRDAIPTGGELVEIDDAPDAV